MKKEELKEESNRFFLFFIKIIIKTDIFYLYIEIKQSI
jgi:hypothetical protein